MWTTSVYLLPVLLASTLGALDRIKVHPTEHWFLDSYGRVRLFHGVNAVNKGFPWYPEYLLDDTRVDDLEEFGLNIVRLGTMWTGTEPAEGVFNHTYVGILKDIVDRLADRGIYAMLDMHQDCLSSYYPPSYDGAPTWLIDTFPEHSEEYPWPLEEITAWEQGYLTQGVSESFQHIYNNTEDALDKWANFWSFISETFSGNPDVIGYNYINEPWIGDYLSNQELLLPGVAGRRNLMPSYDVANEAIREQDKEGIVFYEPVFYGQLFHGDLIGSGFDRVPGGEEYQNVSAYSYHTYCWPLEFIEGDATDEEREYAVEQCTNDTGLIPTMFESQAANVNVTGGASMLTEFGLCKTYEDRIDIECRFYLDLSDEWLQSWVDWDINDGKWYDDEGERIMEKIIFYVRPYARATAGVPTYMNFDHETLDFTFEFDLDADIEAPTEIFVPSLRYTEGFQVTVTEGMVWEMDGDVMYLYPDGDVQTSRMTPVEVTISAVM